MLLRIAIMNVGIRYFDKKLVEESLRGYLKEIEEKHPEVKRVLLFGSFVRDEYVPGSDVLVIFSTNLRSKSTHDLPHEHMFPDKLLAEIVCWLHTWIKTCTYTSFPYRS